MNKIEIVPSLEMMEEVQTFVEHMLTANEISVKSRYQIGIIVDEIFSNIVRYSRAAKAEIACSVCGGLFILQFKDNGIAYNPLEREAPDITLEAKEREIGGLGIFMVKKMVDGIDYQYRENWNMLTIRKRI